MRVVVAGTGLLGASILEPLLEGRHEVVGVLLNGKRVRGALRRTWQTSWLLGAPDVPVRLARRWGVPIRWLDPQSARSVERVAALNPDLIITCGFGVILDATLLSIPTVGCMNVHSSLLPKHRGPMPFHWAVLSGDRHTGVTFHVTTPDVDGGPILDQRALPITRRDTTLSLYRRCCELARQQIGPVVDAVAEHGLEGRPQNENEATYDPPLKRADLRIDWSRPARDLERVIRAGTPNLPAHFMYRNALIEVEGAHAKDAHVDAPPGTVVEVNPHVTVATGHGTLALLRANVARPIAWPWPNGLSRPRPGALLG